MRVCLVLRAGLSTTHAIHMLWTQDLFDMLASLHSASKFPNHITTWIIESFIIISYISLSCTHPQTHMHKQSQSLSLMLTHSHKNTETNKHHSNAHKHTKTYTFTKNLIVIVELVILHTWPIKFILYNNGTYNISIRHILKYFPSLLIFFSRTVVDNSI